jgi:hypothetical protein
MESIPDEILAEAPALFHDTRVEDIDPEAHAAFVIGRVLDHGTLRSVGALLRYYGRDRVRRFLREGGSERIARRTVPLWTAFLEIAPEECTATSSLTGRQYCAVDSITTSSTCSTTSHSARA